MDSTDHRQTRHIIRLHTYGLYRPQNHKPYDNITHMWILQTTDKQDTLSDCTHMGYTDHRTTSHMITLHTCGFYRPQEHKQHYHITHMWVIQTTKPQAIDHIAHMRILQTTDQQAILSHCTYADSTDHRPTNHITHIWVIQTTEPQAI